MVLKTFSDYGISTGNGTGQIRVVCPQCSKDRHKSNDKCLAVNVEEGVWLCHHCGWSGCLGGEKTHEEIKTYFRPRHVHIDLPEDLLNWLKKDRGLSDSTISDHKICLGTIFDNGKKIPAVKFPYFKENVVVNAKHRTPDKRFRQEKNAESCLYRFDEVSRLVTGEVIITEGELDALAFYEAGITHASSVPNGAPAPNAKEYHKEFDYLKSAQAIFDQAKRVVLAVDNDAPGKVLEQELARRIGVEKCYRVIFPNDCKDANDVLIRYGKLKLRELVKEAIPYPVSGIFNTADISDLLLHLYDRGEQRGVSTGWPKLDEYYTVKTGQVTVITGIPGSGKSNWLDALMANLTTLHNWSFAVFSPENWPIQRHAQSIIEKISMRPFDRDGVMSKRMPRGEVKEWIKTLSERFFFIMPDEDSMTLDSILEKARVCIYRNGVKGIAIDPWNEIDHDFGNLTETQYISVMLGKLRRFARRNDVHIWVVAHPQKLLKDKDTGKYKPPTMYEISGGAHWRNKADIGLCVHRPNIDLDITELLIQKIRFREIGKLGAVKFRFSRDTGVYSKCEVLGTEEVNDSSPDKPEF